MFPKWSDWNFQYTRKGLIKNRIRKAVQVITVAAVVTGLFLAGRRNNGIRDAPKEITILIRKYVKQGLLLVWDMVNRGIRLLPE